MKTITKAICCILSLCLLCTTLFSCTLFEERQQDSNNDLQQKFSGKLTEKLAWLNDTTCDTVAKVEVEKLIFGVAPGTTADCYTSTDKTEIADFISFYRNLEIDEVDSSVIENMNGGGGLNIIFTYTDKSTQTIKYRYGYYVIGSQVFKARGSDTPDYKPSFDLSYRFLSGDTKCDVFTNEDEGECVGYVESIGDLRFTIITAEHDDYLTSTHYIEASFGRIYILSNTEFCVYESDYQAYYNLIDGQSFQDFITKNN